MDPKNPYALRNRSLERYYIGDFDGAIADATRSMEIDPNSADSYNNRSLALMAQGDLEAAFKDLEQALRIDPKHTYSRNNLDKLRGQMAKTPASSVPEIQKKSPTQTPPPKPSSTLAEEEATLPQITFTTQDPCQSNQDAPTGLPWQIPDPSPIEVPPGIPNATLAQFLDFNTMSNLQYNGAVSVAMEGMRLIYGELTAEEEQRFQACWAPLFDFPTLDAIDYLNKLNPLLGQFLAGREAFMRAAGAYQITMYNAGLALTADLREGYFDTLAMAERQAGTLRALGAGLADIAKKIKALGNPPNPLTAKCEADRRFKRAVQSAKPAPEGPWILEGEWAGYSESDQYSPLQPRQIVHLVFFKGGQNPMATESMHNLLGFGYAGSSQPSEINWTQTMLEGVEGDRLEYSYETTIEGQLTTVRVVALRVTNSLPPLPDGLRNEDLDKLRLEKEKAIAVWEQRQSSLDYSQIEEAKLKVALELQKFELPIESMEQYLQLRFAFHLTCIDWLNNPPADLGYSTDWSDREDFHKRYRQFQEKLASATTPNQTAAASSPAVSGPTQEEIEAVKETIAFHQSMITILKSNLQKEIDELNLETKEPRRKQLMFRAIQLQSDIQAEQDLIASYQTGQIVHTRSAFDVMAHEQFVRKIKEEAARSDAAWKIAAGVERQIRLLPWEIQASMREKARSILDAKTIGSGNVEKARKVASSLNEIIQGHWQGVAAHEDEKAINAQEYEFYANLTVMTAGIFVVGIGSGAIVEAFGETAALSAWAPHLIGGIWGGTTGLIAGGPVEGLKNSVSWSSTVGFTAMSFLEGYEHSAADPKSTLGDRLWSGAKQAGAGYLIGRVMQFGIGLVTKGALHYYGPKNRLFKPLNWKRPTVNEQFAAAKFQKDVSDARSLIGFFKEKRLALMQARQQNPAGTPQIQQLENELKGLAASLNSSYHCKWLLKYDTHPSVQRAFTSLVDKSYEEMMPDMIRRLKAQGYDTSNIRFKPLRNASSSGSSSMDLDLALQESPGMLIRKNNKIVTLAEFQKDAQKAMNESYHSVTGFNGTRSDLALTTSSHGEAFASKRMLGENVDFSQFTEQEMRSIGSVVNVKTGKIEGDPVLGNIAKMQAKCRESAKEIENMMLKNLRQKLSKAQPGSPQYQQLQSEIRYWQDMLAKFKRIGAQTTNPYEILQLERSIRQDTGGKGTQEVIGFLAKSFK